MKYTDIKPRRKALNWSQTKLGQAIGIVEPTSAQTLIARYEGGNVSEERLALVDAALTKEETDQALFAAFKAGKVSIST